HPPARVLEHLLGLPRRNGQNPVSRAGRGRDRAALTRPRTQASGAQSSSTFLPSAVAQRSSAPASRAATSAANNPRPRLYRPSALPLHTSCPAAVNAASRRLGASTAPASVIVTTP